MLLFAALTAARAGCKVLIVCPTGALVAHFRCSLPHLESIVIQTLHSAFAIRPGTTFSTYSPPGQHPRNAQNAQQKPLCCSLLHSSHMLSRLIAPVHPCAPAGSLRHFDLIIFDELSQVDTQLWSLVAVALGELPTTPFLLLSADMQQLQPVNGTSLAAALEHEVREGLLVAIELHLHAHARTSDATLLTFLQSLRTSTPSLHALRTFFADRVLPDDFKALAAWAVDFEKASKVVVTLLTVTNHAAAVFNNHRVALLLQDDAAVCPDADPRSGALLLTM